MPNLLGEILDDGEIARQMFVPANDPTIDRLDDWENLRDELMYHNRYFPKKSIDLDRLEELLAYLMLDSDELPTVWYRARMLVDDKSYTIDQMSAPDIKLHSMAAPIRRVFLICTLDPSRIPPFQKSAHTLGR